MNTVIHYRPDRHLRTACGQARWTLNSFGETVPLHSFSHPPSRYPVPRSTTDLKGVTCGNCKRVKRLRS